MSGCRVRLAGLTDRRGVGRHPAPPSPDQRPERRGRQVTAQPPPPAPRRARQSSSHASERDCVGFAGEADPQSQRAGQLRTSSGSEATSSAALEEPAASSETAPGRERAQRGVSAWATRSCTPCCPGGLRTSSRGESLRRQASGGEAGGGGGGAGGHHAGATLRGQRSLQAEHNRRGDASHFEDFHSAFEKRQFADSRVFESPFPFLRPLQNGMYLPDDIWVHVLHLLDDHVALCSAALVCRQLRRLAGAPFLWQRLCERLPVAPMAQPAPLCDWRALFQRESVRLRRERRAAQQRRLLVARSALDVSAAARLALTAELKRELSKRVELEGALERHAAASRSVETHSSRCWLPRACRAGEEPVASSWERERLLQILRESMLHSASLSLSLRRQEREAVELAAALHAAEASLP